MAPMRGHVRSTTTAATARARRVTRRGRRDPPAATTTAEPPRRERLLRLIREVGRLRPVALSERNVEPAARWLVHHDDLGRGLAALAPARVVLALLGVAHVAQRRGAALASRLAASFDRPRAVAAADAEAIAVGGGERVAAGDQLLRRVGQRGDQRTLALPVERERSRWTRFDTAYRSSMRAAS